MHMYCVVYVECKTKLSAKRRQFADTRFGMDPEATMIYLADHVEAGRLPPSR